MQSTKAKTTCWRAITNKFPTTSPEPGFEPKACGGARASASTISACAPTASNVEVAAIPANDQPSGSFQLQVSVPIEIVDGDVHITPGDTHTSGPIAIVPPGPRVAIEIASSGSKSTGGKVEAARVTGELSKAKKHKRKGKRHSKGKSSSKSSKRAERRAPRQHFKDMDSFELYKACCMDRDQVLLAQTAHTRVEEQLAHVLMQASAFGHNLALKCSMFRNDKAEAERKIHELQQSLEHARVAEKEALEAKDAADARVVTLEARISTTLEEGKKHVANALEQDRIDRFSTGLLAWKTEGITEGRETFLQSDEYKQAISSARLQGAWDFLRYPVFKMAVDLQSAQFLNDGFNKCITQPYPFEAAPEPAGEDEFASLIAEIGDLP
ncbi:hypothetical protein Salat_0603400 [Sesamum alatum]|uniref:Uncharacterized protein n=1 Tax=Sesamum alatum TaxID=300844 RepID=A0AAE2CTW5_9LAMI|nr:hypothetical protein Salat_0603400 [Sesamum alatum]